jgi:hypothetical protein
LFEVKTVLLGFFLRARETQLQNEHKSELEQLLHHYQKQAEDMLTEFTEAQDILKDKIAELHIL